MEKLLDYFIPDHYDLKLNINKHSGYVQGRVQIEGRSAGRKEVKLHAKGLKVTKCAVSGQSIEYAQADDIITIDLPRSLQTSSKVFTIDIAYSFYLNTNMQGAYLSSYQHRGEKHLLVSTQFESHYARECFPCVDEPAAKATFLLTLITPDVQDVAISNMPIKEEKILEYTTVGEDLQLGAKAKKKIVKFERTPRMSTYLLAFCLGEFKSRSVTNQHGVQITTYCTPNHPVRAVDFANQIAADALDFYDQQFGIKYPLKKLDQVAIPDFEAGAMENWGLVTYRESCLLVDKTTSTAARQGVALVIAHELSHQWFGDLVTMKWWDNLWLNESFASVMEYICVDAIRPEYHIWQEFFTGECVYALRRDALPGVQAVQQEVHEPGEIATLFDGAIVYAKGAHLMLMLIRLMGQEQFMRGLKGYFQQHKYANTTGDDLWAALQPYAEFGVKKFMDAWILQPGYPVLTDLAQQRFLLTGATDDTTWPLPAVTDDMSGHYIINLSAEEFADKLQHFDKLSLEQRLRLLIDRGLLAKTTLVSSATLLELLPNFHTETSKPVWELVADIIGDLKLFFPYEDPDTPAFKKYVDKIIAKQRQRLGISGTAKDNENDIKLRELIIDLSIYTKHTPTLKQLATLYNTDFANLDPELMCNILVSQMELHEKQTFPQLLAAYPEEADPAIKGSILMTLARAEQHTAELLQLLEQPEVVRPQDHIYLFAHMLRNWATRKEAMAWLRTHTDYVEQLSGEKTLEDYFRAYASVVRTKEESAEFDEFAAPYLNHPVLARTIAVAKTDIAARLRLIAVDSADVHAGLKRLGE